MKYLDFTGVEHLIEKIQALFVAKEAGKGLSTNDYTTTEKNKLSNIANGAEVNKIDSIKVNGTTQTITNKSVDITVPSAVTEATVSGWGFTKNTGTYSKPSGGIPKTDLTSAVQTSLGKADSALQEHQDISGKENSSNKVTSISSSNTDTQYPSAKCMYDYINNFNTYSTIDEKKVGIWANGKPIYRKIVVISTVSSSINHNIANIDQVIDYNASFMRAAGENYKLPYNGTSTKITLITRASIKIDNNQDWSGWTLYVTIYYTKTTD